LGRLWFFERLFPICRAVAVSGLVLGIVPAVFRYPGLGRARQVEPRQLPLSLRLPAVLGRDAKQYHPGHTHGDGGDGADFAGGMDRL
jgi:hypothetical protein